MYVVLNDNKKIVAFHEDYDVCEIYVDNLEKSHNISLNIAKIKKKNKHLLKGLDDLYLVRYGHTYVQEGYLQYVEISEGQYLDDIRYAKDVIYRLLEGAHNIKEKDVKTLSKSTKILDRLLEDMASYTPSLDILNGLKMDYEEYIYNLDSY